MKKYVEMLKYFNKIIASEETLKESRIKDNYFSRNTKLGYKSLIKFILSRTGKTTTNEINNYYSEINMLENSVSKQSIFQAREKLNASVFRYLNHKMIRFYYQNNQISKCKGYITLAIDGTVLEMPLTEKITSAFGITKSTDCPTKTSPRCSGLYDVLNHIYLDFLVNHWTVSEIPMAYEQIKVAKEIIKNEKCIFLADRYYGATDLFLYLESLNYKYCFRGKKNFYKHHLDEKIKDGMFHIPLDDTWIKRFKIEEVKEIASNKKELVIRVIRFNKSEITGKDETDNEEIILFSNLSQEEFSTEEIIELYGLRWKIETGYGILKTKLEFERVTSEKVNIILQDVYSQILVHNQISLLKNLCDKKIDGTSKYEYQVNINNLINLFRKWLPTILNQISKLSKIISLIISKILKNKEPIRKNRLFPRWNAYINKPVTLKFRVDGKRNPKVHKTKLGFLRIAR